MSDDPVDYIDMVTCGHDDRSVVADLETCYSHDRYCLGCALGVLRDFRDAPPLLFRDLIRSRFDKVCCHLWFGLADGSFRCECACGHRDRSRADGGGIAVDRLVCAGCLGEGHAVDTPVPADLAVRDGTHRRWSTSPRHLAVTLRLVSRRRHPG